VDYEKLQEEKRKKYNLPQLKRHGARHNASILVKKEEQSKQPSTGSRKNGPKHPTAGSGVGARGKDRGKGSPKV